MARGFHLTIDEWFYDAFADVNKYAKAFQFFYKIYEVCDMIVLKKNTRLGSKFYKLDEDSGKWLPQQRQAVRLIKNLFLANSNKVFWVDETDILNDDIESKLPRKDVYLVAICLKTINKVHVTTDVTLNSNVTDLLETLSIQSFMAEDFIKSI